MGFIRRAVILLALLWTAVWAGLWIHSHRSVECLYCGEQRGGTLHLVLDSGQLKFIWTDGEVPPQMDPPRWISYSPSTADLIRNQLEGLANPRRLLRVAWQGTADSATSGKNIYDGVIRLWWLAAGCQIRWVGIWMGWPAILGLTILAWNLLRLLLRRRKTRGQNLCAHCGYDLRASPGLCPECGQSQAQARRGSSRHVAIWAAALILFPLAIGVAIVMLPRRPSPLSRIEGIWIEYDPTEKQTLYHTIFRPDGTVTSGQVKLAGEWSGTPTQWVWQTDGDLIIVHEPNDKSQFNNAWIRESRLNVVKIWTYPDGSPTVRRYVRFDRTQTMPTSQPRPTDLEPEPIGQQQGKVID